MSADDEANDPLSDYQARIAALEPAFEACRQGFRAMYRGDLEALKAIALPDAELAQALASPPVPVQQYEELERAIEGMQIQPRSHDEATWGEDRLDLLAVFRGLIMPAAVEKVEGEWKFDCRWWIAARRKDGEAEQVARRFLYGMMTVNAELLVNTTLPNPRIGHLLKGSAPPAGEHGQLEHVVETTIFTLAKVGETYPAPSMEMETVKEEDVTGDHMMLFALMAANPPALPIKLAKVNGKWRVDATDFIEMAMQG